MAHRGDGVAETPAGPLFVPYTPSSNLTATAVARDLRPGQIQQFTPAQMDFFKQLQGLASPQSFTSRLASGNPSMFQDLENPALQQFNALQGNLASRFSGMGTGARNSSGFQLGANQAANDFAQQLQSQRLGLQRSAVQDLAGLYQEILGQRPYENFLVPKQKKPSFLQQIAGGLGSGIGSGLGMGIGRGFGSLFGGF